MNTKPSITYPSTHQDTVVEDFHGTLVPDPYRWLEDAAAPETQAWVEQQNATTFGILRSAPLREHLQRRFKEIMDFARYTVPHKEGTRYFFGQNDGLQNQNVIYQLDTLDSTPVEVLDPNKFSEDGTVALSSTAWSHDGLLVAYGVSTHGSDWQEIRIRNLETGDDFPDVIRWCKFSSIAWHHNNTGFYYGRFPEPGTVAPEDQGNYHRVYWHVVGTPQDEDRLVFERPDAKEFGFNPVITDDGRFLVLMVWHGTDPRNRLYYRPVEGDTPFVRLLDEGDAMYRLVDSVDNTFVVHSDADAPRGRIIAIDLERPQREHWRTIVSEGIDPIDFVAMSAERLVVVYKHDVQHQFRVFALDGTPIGTLPTSGIGAVGQISGKRTSNELFWSWQSFLEPPSIYRHDFECNSTAPFRRPQIAFDASHYETTQVFYPSKDGTQIPMFITHRKGLDLGGDHPTILYGYGGFNVSLMPAFSATRLLWLEHGGVLAIANLRGGDEYGEDWHQAGMLERKQNVFDDFIAAGEWLIRQGYTNAEKLASMGGSNGGLLVAACMLQRPDLWGAVVCQVPVTDMLHYHRWTIGRYWVPEYGNAEEHRDHFQWMYAYSPLHNVQRGVRYPPMLITSADTDDRVVPAHAKKFAATLQAANAGNTILLRVETKAGHGAGKPTAKIIEEAADIYTFLFYVFGMQATD